MPVTNQTFTAVTLNNQKYVKVSTTQKDDELIPETLIDEQLTHWTNLKNKLTAGTLPSP